MPRQSLIRLAEGVLTAGDHVRSIETKRMAGQSGWHAIGTPHGYVQLPRLDHVNLLRHRCEDHFDAQIRNDVWRQARTLSKPFDVSFVPPFPATSAGEPRIFSE